MARKSRVHFAEAFYHVIARGNKGAIEAAEGGREFAPATLGRV